MNGLKRFILWDYPRAGWQYDLMVGIILAVIFLIPRDWFHDQPNPTSVVMVHEHGGTAFWIDPYLLDNTAENDLKGKANALVKARYGAKHEIRRVQRVPDDPAQESKGYMAFTTP